MINKWYEEGTQYGHEEYKKRKGNMRKRKLMNICNIVIGISVFCIIGFVGGAEQERMSIAEFIIYELVAVATLLISIGIKTRLDEV